MNGIEKIIARIDADAAAEAAALKAAADEACAGIDADYAARADAAYQKLAAEGKAAADTRYERLCGAAKLDARKELLAEKQLLIGETFDRAVDKLAALDGDAVVALCARLAADASASGREKLIFSPADREKYGAAVCGKANELLRERGRTAELALSDETRDIRGGVILADGKIEMNCSFELLVSGLRGSLSSAVAKALFA